MEATKEKKGPGKGNWESKKGMQAYSHREKLKRKGIIVPEDWLTMEELSAFCKVSRTAIRYRINGEKIKPDRIIEMAHGYKTFLFSKGNAESIKTEFFSGKEMIQHEVALFRLKRLSAEIDDIIADVRFRIGEDVASKATNDFAEAFAEIRSALVAR